jgi:HK97 family phage major capsid protein
MLERLLAQLRALLDERTSIQTQVDNLLAAVEADNRSNLNDDERGSYDGHRSRLAEIDTEAAGLDERIAQIRANQDAARRAADIAARAGVHTNIRVGTEERVYRPDGERGFFADMFSARMLGDATASERLNRHTEQTLERRDIAVAALAGLVPPQYLVDQYAPLARAGRPFLNSLNALPLPPEGVSFTIPRVTTGTAAAMTAEAAGWNEQDMAVTDLTSTVNLVTAQQDISRTLFMRGGPMVDQMIFGDLFQASEVALNLSALNGSGTAPQHRGILQVAGISAVTYTDASPTVGEAWPKLADAIQRINTLRFMPATAIYMHPRRWGWITAAVDSTGRPLFEFSTQRPNVVMGLGTAAEYGQVMGTLQGLPVITDGSIPTNLGAGTNEDIIFVARTADVLYWEDDLMQFTFEQTLSTAPGQVRLAAGRFSLLAAGRYPTSISTIGGTGLVPPAF